MANVQDRLIYHITHVDNLPSIISDGYLWSDYEVQQRKNQRTVIGFDTIKRRRLEELSVSCHPTTFVGQYVPLYFCPRSPMLYVIYRQNAELAYQKGQERIIHLVAQIGGAIAGAAGRPWAFSDGNAGARYARFCNNLDDIDSYVDWNAIRAKYWSDPTVKERKQAEFLVHGSFPWSSILGIGVRRQELANEVQQILADAEHQPRVIVKPEWYY